MQLFLETPEMRARRLERAADSQMGAAAPSASVCVPDTGAHRRRSALFDDAFTAPASSIGAPGSSGSTPDGRVRRVSRSRGGAVRGGAAGQESDAAAASAAASAQASAQPAPQADGGYSIEQESYQEALAFHRQRARRSMRRAAVRVVLIALGVPLALALIFIAAYVFTCVLDGATPQEVGVLLIELFHDVAGLVHDVTGW